MLFVGTGPAVGSKLASLVASLDDNRVLRAGAMAGIKKGSCGCQEKVERELFVVKKRERRIIQPKIWILKPCGMYSCTSYVGSLVFFATSMLQRDTELVLQSGIVKNLADI